MGLFSSSAPLRWEEGNPNMGTKSHIFSLILLAGTACGAPAEGGHHAVHVEGHHGGHASGFVEGHKECHTEYDIRYAEECHKVEEKKCHQYETEECHEEYDEEISITYIEECEERVYETCDESVTEIHHNQHPVSHSTHVTADNYRYTPTEVIHLVKRSAQPQQYQPGYHKQEPKRTPYRKCEKIPHEECTPVYHEECHPVEQKVPREVCSHYHYEEHHEKEHHVDHVHHDHHHDHHLDPKLYDVAK